MMQANRKHLVLNLEKGADLPETLDSDERRLHQVLLNLLINAVKYTPSERKITIRVAPDPQETDMIMFQVADEGIGMSLKQRLQLFKLFDGAKAEAMDQDEKKRGSEISM